jgi:4-hydroxy-2-oxoheptanedioate aldolase
VSGANPGTAPRLGLWLSTANAPALEMAAALGYSFVLLDVEHGAFDLTGIDHVLLMATELGLEPLVKVLGPERSPIQQALDLGAAGVVIPHVLDAGHARSVTEFAKFPPAGDRSYAGGRTVGYTGPGEDWFAQQDAATGCYPMIEDWRALRDVDEIVGLPTVDGLCMGMSDLSLSRGRGLYRRSAQDWDDLAAAAGAAAGASKTFIMPAWTESE